MIGIVLSNSLCNVLGSMAQVILIGFGRIDNVKAGWHKKAPTFIEAFVGAEGFEPPTLCL
jgi:hypothetical protein